MLCNALQMHGLACGRFDFKGGIDMNEEVRAFIQHLAIPAPPPSSIFNERQGQILTSVLEHTRPTLLIFDTYEAAPKPQQDWPSPSQCTTTQWPCLSARIADRRTGLRRPRRSFGGLGRNGAQHTVEAMTTTLAAVGSGYEFASGRVCTALHGCQNVERRCAEVTC